MEDPTKVVVADGVVLTAAVVPTMITTKKSTNRSVTVVIFSFVRWNVCVCVCVCVRVCVCMFGSNVRFVFVSRSPLTGGLC